MCSAQFYIVVLFIYVHRIWLGNNCPITNNWLGHQIYQKDFARPAVMDPLWQASFPATLLNHRQNVWKCVSCQRCNLASLRGTVISCSMIVVTTMTMTMMMAVMMMMMMTNTGSLDSGSLQVMIALKNRHDNWTLHNCVWHTDTLMLPLSTDHCLLSRQHSIVAGTFSSGASWAACTGSMVLTTSIPCGRVKLPQRSN